MIIRRRVPDWPERLAALIEKRRNVPFAWGENDCLTFALDAIEAVTGRRVGDEWRGRYFDENGAIACGLDCFEMILDAELAKHAFLEVSVASAQRGDLALIVGDTEKACLGVIVGEAACGPGPRGLVTAPLHRVRRAWAV